MNHLGIAGGVIGAASLLGACGSAGGGSAAEGEDRIFDPDVEEVFRYGTAFGDATEMLGDQVQLGFDASGQLFILDASSSRILVVSPEGEYVREFGRQGEGPGELSRPLGMLVEDDGSVAILDATKRAFTRFDPDGEYVGDTRTDVGFTPAEQVGYLAAPGQVVFLGEGFNLPAAMGGRGQGGPGGGGNGAGVAGRRGGGARGQGRGGPEDFNPFGDYPETIPVRRISLLDGTSEIVHETWRPALPVSTEDAVGIGGAMGRFFANATVGFLPTVQFGAFRDGRIAVLDSTTYQIDIIGASGGVEAVLRREIAPRVVTEELIQMETDRRIAEIEAGNSPMMQGVNALGIMGGRGGGGGMEQAAMTQMIMQMELEQIEQMQYGPEVPVLKVMVVDRGGRIWVERTPESLQGPGPIDVFSVDAGYLGTFEPGAFGIPSAFGPDGRAAFIERDEFDVPTVVVRRLPDPLR